MVFLAYELPRPKARDGSSPGFFALRVLLVPGEAWVRVGAAGCVRRLPVRTTDTGACGGRLVAPGRLIKVARPQAFRLRHETKRL